MVITELNLYRYQIIIIAMPSLSRNAFHVVAGRVTDHSSCALWEHTLWVRTYGAVAGSIHC